MATEKVTLVNGLKVKSDGGEVVHIEAEVREATAGDFIEASEESERVCATSAGDYVLLASPTMVALNTLRRQVVRIGEYKGPLSIGELKKLSAGDLNLLQETSAKLERAAMEAIKKQGE